MSELPKPPAQVAPYVDALGVDDAVAFLLKFGGSEIYIAENPQSRSRVVKLLGRQKAAALARVSERLPARVPLANRWVAKVLFAKGLPKAEIARRLRTTDKTVREWLRDAPTPDRAQLSLPFDSTG